MDRRRILKNILTMRKKDRTASVPGNQTCAFKAGSADATPMPANANTKTMSMKPITIQQAGLESYQGVMTFLKNGFWSRRMAVWSLFGYPMAIPLYMVFFS